MSRPAASALFVGVVVVAILGVGGWLWATAGRETTDDAQVDAHVTPIAARVGGTVLKVPVADNQEVEAGTVLVEIDRRDFELDARTPRAPSSPTRRPPRWLHARAFRSRRRRRRARCRRLAAVSSRPTQASREAEQAIEAAKARLATAQARLREAAGQRRLGPPGTSSVSSRCSRRTKSRSSNSTRPSPPPTRRAPASIRRAAQITEAELAVRVAESRLAQAQRRRGRQAAAGLATRADGARADCREQGACGRRRRRGSGRRRRS